MDWNSRDIRAICNEFEAICIEIVIELREAGDNAKDDSIEIKEKPSQDNLRGSHMERGSR